MDVLVPRRFDRVPIADIDLAAEIARSQPRRQGSGRGFNSSSERATCFTDVGELTTSHAVNRVFDLIVSLTMVEFRLSALAFRKAGVCSKVVLLSKPSLALHIGKGLKIAILLSQLDPTKPYHLTVTIP